MRLPEGNSIKLPAHTDKMERKKVQKFIDHTEKATKYDVTLKAGLHHTKTNSG